MRDNFPIYHETLGDPANPCIVLINGLGSQLIHWPTAFIQGLAKRGYFIVRFDNRDAGLSHYYDEYGTPDVNEAIAAKRAGKPFYPPYTLDDMATDVITLLDKLMISKAHMVGMSMGGMIAGLVASHYSDRTLSLTCIASTSGNPSLPPAKPEVLSHFFSPQKNEDGIESYIENLMKLHKIYFHPDHLDEEKDRDFYKKLYQRAYHPSGLTRQLLAIIGTGSLVEKLKQLKTTSLIIHGDYDPAFPIEHGKELASILTHSTFVLIPKMGHGLPDSVCEKLVGLCDDFYRTCH